MPWRPPAWSPTAPVSTSENQTAEVRRTQGPAIEATTCHSRPLLALSASRPGGAQKRASGQLEDELSEEDDEPSDDDEPESVDDEEEPESDAAPESDDGEPSPEDDEPDPVFGAL